jgi:hypothetical protein
VLHPAQVPDELDNIPMVDEALAAAAYPTNTGGTGGGRTPSRKTRWTTEQIEALIEGVEKYGLSAWRTIVMVSCPGTLGYTLVGQGGWGACQGPCVLEQPHTPWAVCRRGLCQSRIDSLCLCASCTS